MPFLLHGTHTAVLMEIPSGEEGIARTLKEMVGIVRKFKTTPALRQLAAQLFRDAGLAQGDFLGEITVLHAFVRDSIRYMGDVHDVETLQTPQVTLQLEAGDCDDKCMLLASLLECTNHPARFVALGMGGKGFSHVIVETKLKGRWMTCETCRNVRVGWTPPNITTRMRAHC